MADDDGVSVATGSARRWLGHVAVLRRDPVLLFLVVLGLLTGVLFVVLDGHTTAQVRIFWIFQPATDLVLAFCSWRVSRHATGAIRRFWLVLAAVGLLFTAGDSYQAHRTVIDPARTSTTGGTVQTVCFAIGLAVVVLAMIVHPHPDRTGRERLAFWLDSATLVISGVVLAWVFSGSPGQPDVLGTLVDAGVSIGGTFAAVKMVLSGNAPMNKLAAFPMIGSAAVMALGIVIAPASGTTPAPVVYLIRFLPSLLIASGPRIQEVLTHLEPTPFGERRRKPYSLLPYGSMALAFVALVMVLPHGVNARLWGVVAGLALICALVAARQLVAFHDNTALIRRLRDHEARLRHQALTDGLTGLANRTHFHERATAALTREEPVGLLVIDLDGFKAVNDTMGHAGGDALLIGVAAKLRDTVRDQDLPARLGGDEFAVLLPGCPRPDAEATAQRLLEAFQIPVAIDGVLVPVNASIGVATAGRGDDVDSLLRDADLAMYAAKAGGKGTWKSCA